VLRSYAQQPLTHITGANHRWHVLAVVSAASFMVYMDATVVIIAFPSLQASFDEASRSGLSWALYGYSVIFAALLVPAGRWGDMLGRTRAFTIGLVIFVAASAACAGAPSAVLLIAARVIQAAGGALLVPNAQALLMDAFPKTQRALAVGLFSGAGAIAAAIGPSLGGLLVDLTSWRLIFLINVPIGLAALGYGKRVLIATDERHDAASPDLLGVVLLAGGVGALTLAITQGKSWGWSSDPVLACLASSAVLLPLFVLRCARHAAPVLEIALFRDRRLAVANVASLVFAAAFFGVLFAGVLFLTTVWGYSPLRTGISMTPAPVLALITAVIGGLLTDRYGPRWVVVPGAAIFGAGAGWALNATTLHPDYLGAWLPATVLIGIGVGLCAPALNTTAVTALSEARFGVGSGINGMMRQLGAALGVAAIVAVVGSPTPAEAVGAFQGAWAFAACAAAITVVLGLLIPRSEHGAAALS
jgi:EmrB/QacA subfamily drug resistance transporter